MFDDLLSQFDTVLAQAKSCKKNKVVCSESERSDIVGCDYTKTLGKFLLMQEQYALLVNHNVLNNFKRKS